MRETFPELQGQGVFERVERVYASGEPLIEHEVERSWDRGDGVERRLVDLVSQPLHGEDGDINGVVSFAVDVTELVSARNSARFAEQLAAVLELIPSGLLLVDAEGRVVRWNEIALRSVLEIDATLQPAAATESLRLGDEQGAHVTPADIRITRTPDVRPAPRIFSVNAGDPPRLIRFWASVSIVRGADGTPSGAVLVVSGGPNDRSVDV
jgi:PAS domain-containing protein